MAAIGGFVKRIVSLCLIVAAALVVFGRATCQRGPTKVTAQQVMKIEDHVYYHNVGITWDGSRYYTVNGGNENWGMVNVYDGKGKLLESFDVEVDGRGIYWNPEEEMLYVKNFGNDLYAVDPDDGDCDVDLEYVFDQENSSPAMSADGAFYLELTDDGEVRVLESFLGDEEDVIEIDRTSEEHGYSYALAASDKYLFTWDVGGVVYVHDYDGEYVTRVELPRDGFGFSLSWANGMLWIADDADGADDGADGYWYGYKLKGLK
jgi:DNA-binding beta-propeller fold protein YncE